MFESLSDKLDLFFKKIRGQAKFTEKNIDEISHSLRMTLLEADVNYQVAKAFVEKIRLQAIGKKVHESLTPQQHYIDIVRQELTEVLGGQTAQLHLRVKPPVVMMIVGLQGSGKTTTCGKLAKYLTEEHRRSVLLVSTDIYRPAAMDQLKVVAQKIGIPCFDSRPDQTPAEICSLAFEEAGRRGRDVIIIDTAGRHQVDAELMKELVDIKAQVSPHEILLVADAMTGQEAVRVAQGFNDHLDMTGIILSKMDADARGGAALSMTQVTQKPIKFVGVGEKVDALERFHPDRLATRILKMGDMLSLIEKTKKAFDETETRVLEKKLGTFTLDDFKTQIGQMKKMGSVQELMNLIPGAGKRFDQAQACGISPEKELKKVAVIIDSMTPQERKRVDILNGSRRLRIARGSGVQVSDVNRMIKQFLQTKKMMKRMTKFGTRSRAGFFNGGEKLW